MVSFSFNLYASKYHFQNEIGSNSTISKVLNLKKSAIAALFAMTDFAFVQKNNTTKQT